MENQRQPVTFRLCTTLTELNRLSEHLEQIGAQWNLDGKTVLQLNLVLDEIFTNVVSYGITEQSSQSVVTFSIRHRGDAIEVVVSDSGKAFDLTRAQDPNLDLPLEEKPSGGLGIFLVRQYTDSITYKREDGKNILTLTKRI